MVFDELYTMAGIAIAITVGTIVDQLSNRSKKFPRVIALVFGGFLISEISLGFGFLQPFIEPMRELEFIEFTAEFALSVVLFREGLEINLKSFRSNLRQVIILATVGVVLTSIIFASLLFILTGIGFLLALLIAGILAPTDPAATFSLFKGGLRINPREQNIIGNESALNDAVAIVLVTTVFIKSVEENHFVFNFNVILNLITAFFGAILIGYTLARIFLYLNSKIEREVQTNFLSLGLVILSFTISIHLSLIGIQISAAIASLSAGIVFANPMMFNVAEFSQIDLHEFNETISEFAEIVAFVTLGTLMRMTDIGYSILLGLLFAFLILVSRGITVVGIVRRFTNLQLKESLFISWAGMRGLATGVLATIALIDIGTLFPNLSISTNVFLNSILIALIITTLIQTLSVERIGKETGSVQVMDRKIELEIKQKIIASKLTFYREKYENGEVSREVYQSKTIPLRDQLDKINNELRLERQGRETRISQYLRELELISEVKLNIEQFLEKNYSNQNIKSLPGYDRVEDLYDEEKVLVEKFKSEMEVIKITFNSSTTAPSEVKNIEQLTKQTKSSLVKLRKKENIEGIEGIIEICNDILDEHYEEEDDKEQELEEIDVKPKD